MPSKSTPKPTGTPFRADRTTTAGTTDPKTPEGFEIRKPAQEDQSPPSDEEAKVSSPTVERPFHPRIDTILFSYADHTVVDGLGDKLRNTFTFEADFKEFLDPTGTAFADADRIIETFKGQYAENLHQMVATNTPVRFDFHGLLTHCQIFSKDHIANCLKPMRNAKAVENALKNLERHNRRGTNLMFTVKIDLSSLYVNMDHKFEIHNFSIFSRRPFPVTQTQTPAAATATTTTDPNILQLIQTLDSNTRQMIQAVAPKPYSPKIPHSFIPLNFPPEVQERVKMNTTDYDYPTKSSLTPFTTTTGTFSYFIDPQHQTTSFVALDGTYFTIEDQGATADKNFRMTVTKCTGSKPHEVATWYNGFTTHCIRFGKYCHPYACFQRNAGHPRGFTVGMGTDDSVPATYATKIDRDNRLIWDVLVIAFQDHPEFLHIVQLNNGHGYETLRGILRQSHPNMIDDPTSLIASRPKQKGTSLLDYWRRYNHYIMIRALIEDNDKMITSKTELRLFVHGCKYGAYLEAQLRREEHVQSLQHKFTPSNIIATLENYLEQSDSPRRVDLLRYKKTDNLKPSSSKRSNDSNPYYKAIRQLELAATNDSHENSDTDNESTASIDDDPVPFVYNAWVQQIKRNPQSAESRICLVCDVINNNSQPHKFEDCPVLQQHDVVRKHFIAMCSTIRRTRKALTTQIQALTTQDEETVPSSNLSPSSSSNDESDFP